MDNNFMIALTLTILAGLSTSIGSIIALFSKKEDKKFLSAALGFSSGVMLFVSLVDIYPTATTMLTETLSEKQASWITFIGFFLGILLIILIQKFMPEENFEKINKKNGDKALLRIGVFTALVIAIHNFPEGLATFMSSLQDPKLGLPIALAIALHNIPEGLAVAIPIYYATGDRKKAFLYSNLSGITEPLGAIIGYFLLKPIMNDVVMGLVFSSVGGIMVYISLFELLPSARKYGTQTIATKGFLIGMFIMGLSLQVF